MVVAAAATGVWAENEQEDEEQQDERREMWRNTPLSLRAMKCLTVVVVAASVFILGCLLCPPSIDISKAKFLEKSEDISSIESGGGPGPRRSSGIGRGFISRHYHHTPSQAPSTPLPAQSQSDLKTCLSDCECNQGELYFSNRTFSSSSPDYNRIHINVLVDLVKCFRHCSFSSSFAEKKDEKTIKRKSKKEEEAAAATEVRLFDITSRFSSLILALVAAGALLPLLRRLRARRQAQSRRGISRRAEARNSFLYRHVRQPPRRLGQFALGPEP